MGSSCFPTYGLCCHLLETKENLKGIVNKKVDNSKSVMMLLLRYQRQRQGEGGGDEMPHEHDMRRKINDRDIKNDSHRAATRSTLICIFVCGSLLLSLGLAVLFVGLLVPGPRDDPTPWLVIGPTCIVLGILVLLLSVEIILKLRKISSSSRSSVERDSPPKESWTLADTKNEEAKTIPVIIHPPTPMQQLNPVTLPSDIVQHR
nr:uncharacterized protein LOC107444838 isoform X2 [Parasteatoda tepidariorum]